jgi:PhnB protein
MKTQTAFAPLLIIENGVTDIDFYKNAFGAVEHFRFTNDDGSVHVAEFDINGALFHLHEQKTEAGSYCPHHIGGVTVTIGLMADDVHAVYDKAVAAGAKIITPVTDYDYGYRQGDLLDPFGHQWTIQKKI